MREFKERLRGVGKKISASRRFGHVQSQNCLQKFAMNIFSIVDIIETYFCRTNLAEAMVYLRDFSRMETT